jgi:hypothetical protein
VLLPGLLFAAQACAEINGMLLPLTEIDGFDFGRTKPNLWDISTQIEKEEKKGEGPFSLREHERAQLTVRREGAN